MRRCRSWYRIRRLLHRHLPLPPGPLSDSLALWLKGRLLAENGCLDRLAVAHGTRREEAAALGRALGAVGPPASQPPVPGHGLPRGPAGLGTLVDAALAAAPTRSLRAGGPPHPGPGVLTRSPASVTQRPSPTPRPRTSRAGLHASHTAHLGTRPSARPVNPQPRHGTLGTRGPDGLWQPPISHTRSHTYTCQR